MCSMWYRHNTIPNRLPLISNWRISSSLNFLAHVIINQRYWIHLIIINSNIQKLQFQIISLLHKISSRSKHFWEDNLFAFWDNIAQVDPMTAVSCDTSELSFFFLENLSGIYILIFWSSVLTTYIRWGSWFFTSN